MKRAGYTLVELLVTITLITLLTTFGISAYGRAQASQAARAATESIMSALTEAQKKASSGTSDCTTEYLGQRVDFQTDNIRITTVCKNGVTTSDGSHSDIALTSVTFNSPPSPRFRPLNQGVIIPSSTANISYTVSGATYIIQLSASGSITNLGKQQ